MSGHQDMITWEVLTNFDFYRQRLLLTENIWIYSDALSIPVVPFAASRLPRSYILGLKIGDLCSNSLLLPFQILQKGFFEIYLIV
jgi:hypothetical protein